MHNTGSSTHHTLACAQVSPDCIHVRLLNGVAVVVDALGHASKHFALVLGPFTAHFKENDEGIDLLDSRKLPEWTSVAFEPNQQHGSGAALITILFVFVLPDRGRLSKTFSIHIFLIKTRLNAERHGV